MLKGLGNLTNLLCHAQELGGRLQALKDRLRNERIIANCGGGMVEVEMNGLAEVLRVSIDKDLVRRGETEMIEDLVAGAVNQASRKARAAHAQLLNTLTTGFNLPELADALAHLAHLDFGTPQPGPPEEQFQPDREGDRTS